MQVWGCSAIRVNGRRRSGARHLVESAWLANPEDVALPRARQQVFTARAARSGSTMARGVFTWAANESGAHAGTDTRQQEH